MATQDSYFNTGNAELDAKLNRANIASSLSQSSSFSEQSGQFNTGNAELDAKLNSAAQRSQTPQSSQASQAPAEKQKLRTAAQGLTFGFADEIEALIRSVGGGEGQTYEAIRNDIRNKLTAYKDQNPGESLTIETLGALAPTALSLLSGVGSGAGAANVARLAGRTGQLARTGTNVIPQAATLAGRVPRLAQGAATGAVYGGLYGAGTAEGGLESRIQGAKDLAGTGALLGAGGQALIGGLKGTAGTIANVFKGTSKLDIPTIQNKSIDIGRNAFKGLEDQAAAIDVKIGRDVADSVEADLIETYNITPDRTNAVGDNESILRSALVTFRKFVGKDYTKEIDNLVEAEIRKPGFNLSDAKIVDAKGQRFNLNANQQSEKINKIRQDITNSDAFNKGIPEKINLKELYDLRKSYNRMYTNSVRRGVEEPNLLRFVDAIDDMVDSNPTTDKLWQNARGLWSTSKKFETVADAIERADLSTATSGVGDKIGSLKSAFKSIVTNKRESKFFTSDEINGMKELIKGNFITNQMRRIGKLSLSGPGAARWIGLGSVLYTSGGTLPIIMFGKLAQNSSNKTVRLQAERLLRDILEGDEQMLKELGNAYKQSLPQISNPISQNIRGVPQATTPLMAGQ
jgi:hypothetical protein